MKPLLIAIALLLGTAATAEAQVFYYQPYVVQPVVVQPYLGPVAVRTRWFPGKFFTCAPRWAVVQPVVLTAQ
jgi:hypothetical protein